MRNFGRAGAAAIAAGTALAIAGCGSSHSTAASTAAAPHSTAMIGNAAISRAASISGAAKGEKVAYTFTEQLPSVGKLTMTGTGSFNNSPEQGSMDMNLSLPGASSLGSQAAAILSNLQLNFVLDDGSVYVQIPSSLSSMASSFTGGKPWVSINLAKLASGSSIPGLSGLFNGSTSPANPMAELQQLEQASSSGVTKVGPATVNGVATTEYTGTLDLSKLSSSLPAAQRAAMKKILARSVQQTGTKTIPYTVYIDSANLIRRLSISITPSLHGTSVPITMQMDYLAYGQQPAPTIPAASQTDDLTSLLSQASSMGMGSGGASGGSFFGG